MSNGKINLILRFWFTKNCNFNWTN